MTAKAIEVIWWIIGTFGIAGLVAFWFLAPTAAQLVLQRTIKLFAFALSYRIGCAVLAALVAGVIAAHWQHSRDDEQFAARAAAFEQAQTERDARINENTSAKVKTWADDAVTTNATIDNDVKGFNDAVPSAPEPTSAAPAAPAVNPLRISDADADRLCKLAGQTVCEPGSGEGVPKARRPGDGPAHKGVRLPHVIRAGTRPNQ